MEDSVGFEPTDHFYLKHNAVWCGDQNEKIEKKT